MPQRYRKSTLSTASAYPKEVTERRKTWRRLLVICGFALLLTMFTFSPAAPPKAREAAQRISPFKPAAHKPPKDNGEALEEATWFPSLNWLHPFSDTVNSEDSRVVLPPLRKRPPIYAFYDILASKDDAVKEAENKLLLIWRRAWWAQGFRPVILGRAEATANGLYTPVKDLDLEPSLKAEIMRWLAWGHMGNGILSNWLVLPMGPRDDEVLSYLRRGNYSDLRRWEGLGVGLFAGCKDAINNGIRDVIGSTKVTTAKSMIEVIPKHSLKVKQKPASIAFYDSKALAENYSRTSQLISQDRPAGLKALGQLIVSHLHLTFLNTFMTGIAVVSPFAAYTKVLTQWARTLASALVKCPESPMPKSCPPNNLRCYPCSASRLITVTNTESFSNASSTYTIGTVPHPYTLTALRYPTREITLSHVRRNTPRDSWLEAITQDILGTAISSYSRISPFKETVASEYGAANGLWVTEDPKLIPEHRDLEWRFGFPLPFLNSSEVSRTVGNDKSARREFELQERLLDEARQVIRSGTGGQGKAHTQKGIREVTEAWNLADTEAWRFVRSLGARGKHERQKWEDEEKDFAGRDDEGTPKGWGKWFDR